MSEENKIQPEETPQEQPVNKPTDKNSSSAEPITEVEQPLTLNPQPSTSEDMEVHHHTHAAHGKKNLKSYFWEFLMLFLAVFLWIFSGVSKNEPTDGRAGCYDFFYIPP